jgi:type I restriction enzyme M protein
MSLLFDSLLSAEDNLLRRFEEIHDYIYAHDGLSPQQTLEEFVKVLFIKISDEQAKLNKFNISAQEWSELEARGTALSLTERIAGLFEQTKQSYPDIFAADDRIKLSPRALGFTVNKLQSISLLDSSPDAKGLAFQKFLSHHEKDGQGQFFTPTPIIDFCVALLQPKPNETIIDPACGSGGFLLSSLRYLQNNYHNLDTERIITQQLFGLDINKSIARIAKMKLLLAANVKTNIFCANSLETDNFNLSEGFDIVLANPPFGAKITNPSLLSTFDLGHKWAFSNNHYHKTKVAYPNQNAEILFVERCLQLLKEGGRMAIVLPNGNFENPSLEYLRYYIKLKAKLLAIVNLPQETFIPYGTGVKTSLLFLEKETPNKFKEYPIFFGRVKKLGYQGNKNGTPLYQKDKYGQTLKDLYGRPLFDEDFSVILEAYKSFQKGNKIETANSFSINYNELNGRFDFDFYSPENRNLLAGLAGLSTVRLGDVCDIIKLKSKKLRDTNLAVEYIELSDINTHSYEIINSTAYQVYELPSRASYEIEPGDIITAIAGNSVGTQKHATALVTADFAGSICTNGFRVLRNFTIDPYFLLYFLKSEVFLRQMFMYRTGAAIPNVSDTDLANIRIYLPTDAVIKRISEKVKRAFDLRQQARHELDAIQFVFAAQG